MSEQAASLPPGRDPATAATRARRSPTPAPNPPALKPPPLAVEIDGTRARSRRRWPRLGRLRSLGLRNRIMLIFTLGALLLSTVLAATTYGLVRSNLMSNRDDAAIASAYRSAQEVHRRLQTGDSSRASEAIRDLVDFYGVQWPLVMVGDDVAHDTFFTRDALPPDLVERVHRERQPARMVTTVGGNLMLVVGIPLQSPTASYFEAFSLEDARDTLSNVGLSLIFAAVTTTLLGVVVGVFASRRAVRPVASAAQAAKAIAGGRLDTRLEPTDDPDLGMLANAFNEMASSLERRVEHDARFASDVSHELRSPLMTLSASMEVIQSRRDEMPERAQAALDLLTGDVTRFQSLVEDLLEIGRFDSGAVRLHVEPLNASEFLRHAVAVSSLPDTPVFVSERAERAVIYGDRRRLARVIANLIDNARAYGGGETTVTISEADPTDEDLTHLVIAVEDQGPGVPEDERDRIFERFSRGTGAAGRRVGSEGAGLGLSLVAEHVRLHGGRVWVEDRLDGQPGARFVVELEATEPEAATAVEEPS